MNVNLNLFDTSLKQLDAAITALVAYRNAIYTAENTLTSSVEQEVQALVLPVAAAPAPVAEEAKPEVVAEEPAPKKTRQKKQAEPASQATVKEPETAAEPATEISIDDLRSALQRLTADMGMPAGIELLKKFGCNRVSELAALDEATKQQFLDRCPSQEVEA